ncbi:TPA: hypothetical protein DDZ86_00205 [Candidatus Dependentiae bacterium]|nr:MAG: hypothetical protein UW09_C0002G0080 [candidate division TM6 bacterium GW2011_GWF2_43_87]HBL98050.1 hypothetical protein [Candidatus Dependentiae bacterium]
MNFTIFMNFKGYLLIASIFLLNLCTTTLPMTTPTNRTNKQILKQLKNNGEESNPSLSNTSQESPERKIRVFKKDYYKDQGILDLDTTTNDLPNSTSCPSLSCIAGGAACGVLIYLSLWVVVLGLAEGGTI